MVRTGNPDSRQAAGADAQGGRGSARGAGRAEGSAHARGGSGICAAKGGRLSPLPGHGASLRWETLREHLYVCSLATHRLAARSRQATRQGHTRQEALLARAAQRP